MLMDKMTEMVAHMIGIFHTTIEEERMRDAFDKFKSMLADDPDIDPLQAIAITFRAKYSLEGFTPGLQYADEMASDTQINFASPYYSNPSDHLIPTLQPSVSASANDIQPYQEASGFSRPSLTLEPPGSIVVITVQNSFLSDNDFIRLGDGETEFTDLADLLAQLQQVQTVATAISAPISAEMIIPGEGAAHGAIALHNKMTAAEVTPLTGVSATLMHGADAVGFHVDGAVADELPDIDDLWPVFESDNGDSENEGASTETASDQSVDDHEFPDPFEGMSSSEDASGLDDNYAGHSVVTGANTLVNEVVINSAWIDAPVVSVMGDAIDLNVISQINVLLDFDYGTFDAFATSTTMNAASMIATITTQVPEEGEDATDDASDHGLPSNWAVTQIEGDLIAINQVSQYSFVTDNDSAEITFSSSDTYITMGDNSVFNLTNLSELGFGYDLIIIGGSMISVNWINQMNVLIDNDMMTYDGEMPVSFSGNDNLLFNGAIINTDGVDSYGDMQDNFAAASDSFANGAVTIDESVAHDSVFEGVDLIRVLYIEGDLTTINWIEQTNILGDSDQVHLSLDEFEAATGTNATVTAGSNSMVNMATINEYGVDSTVMVQGDVYDDALLYQAELIDTNADPLGVGMPALVTEAVVFLADDMMTPEIGIGDAPIAPTPAESTASPDVMQSMLA